MTEMIDVVDSLDISNDNVILDADFAVQKRDESGPVAVVAFEPLTVIAEYAGPIITATVKRREGITQDDCIEIIKGKKYIDGRESSLRDVPIAVWGMDANCIYTKRDLKIFLIAIRKISAGDKLQSLSRIHGAVDRTVRYNTSCRMLVHHLSNLLNGV